jgi:predicted nucleic acid-binding protein
VLLYAASGDPKEAAKARKARELLRSVRFGLSVQVLQEFYVNATGKLATKIPEEQLQNVLAQLRRQTVAPVTMEMFDAAVDISRRFQISYWDAAIVAAATQLGAKTIYSEDLADGQEFDGIKVVNPFTKL